MGQALYRKYRSKNLAEIIGQPHITQTLRNALTNNLISHAYLLSGPRGVGKTSVARILAHEVNNLPYDETATHLDIIEIDAASNRRIDEIRELRERVNNAPVSSKYKVYIIDEVHMLTKEAFNALLKTLEEPPAHVIFILATTEPHKLPETIVSRTQHLNFKPITNKDLAEHLITIAKKEKINIDLTALELIALNSEGSFRDALSMLDQVRNSDRKISTTEIEKLLGIPSSEALQEIMTAILNNDSITIVNTLGKLKDGGFSEAQIAKLAISRIRDAILIGQAGNNRQALFNIMHDLIEVQASANPDIALLLAFLKHIEPEVTISEPIIVSDQPTLKIEPVSDDVTQAPVIELGNLEPLERKDSADLLIPKPIEPNELWNKLLASLKASHNTLYGIIRMAEPMFENNKLILVFQFAFHQKRISESRYKNIMQTTLKEITGENYELHSTLKPKLEITKPQVQQPQTSTNLKKLNEIFGEVEMLD